MKGLYYIIGVVLLSCILCGCRTTSIVEVPVIHTEFVRHDSIVRDSVHITDSVLIFKQGDTIFNTKVKYIYRYKSLQLHDTLAVHDTLTIVKEVEKRLSSMQRAYMTLGRTFLLLLIICASFLIFWLLRR